MIIIVIIIIANLIGTFHMPGTWLNTMLYGTIYYYPHFMDEETEAYQVGPG